MAKQYLEEYYHNLELRSTQRIRALKKSKKRSISFNQQDLHRPRWHHWKSATVELPSGVKDHSRRMSVDVGLLLGQYKVQRQQSLSLTQWEHTKCSKMQSATEAIEQCVSPPGNAWPSPMATPHKPTVDKKKWKPGILKRFFSEPEYNLLEDNKDNGNTSSSPDTVSIVDRRWSWRKKKANSQPEFQRYSASFDATTQTKELAYDSVYI